MDAVACLIEISTQTRNMTSARNRKHKAILDAATRIFIERGYNGASMDAIAEAAPVSKPTLYSHFENKHDLFAAVIDKQCEALLDELTSAHTETGDFVSSLSTIARSFVDLIYSVEALAIYRLIVAEQQQFPTLGELVYLSGPKPVLDRLSAFLKELDERGPLSISDPDSSARLFVGMLQGDEHLRCLLGLQSGLSEAKKTGLMDAAVTLFIRGHRHEK
ncbi:MAG: TetR/AcrR family transcriptional regulator [Pseudomonadota bacterium]